MHTHRHTTDDDYSHKNFHSEAKPEPKILSALSSNRRMPTLLEIENFQSQGNLPKRNLNCVCVQ